MRVVVIDNDALEAKQSYYFSKRIPVATGLLIGRVGGRVAHRLSACRMELLVVASFSPCKQLSFVFPFFQMTPTRDHVLALVQTPDVGFPADAASYAVFRLIVRIALVVSQYNDDVLCSFRLSSSRSGTLQ